MADNIRALEIGEPIVEESKFSLVLASSCPKCGAPIWIERPENNFNKVPENIFSCECRGTTKKKTQQANDGHLVDTNNFRDLLERLRETHPILPTIPPQPNISSPNTIQPWTIRSIPYDNYLDNYRDSSGTPMNETWGNINSTAFSAFPPSWAVINSINGVEVGKSLQQNSDSIESLDA